MKIAHLTPHFFNKIGGLQVCVHNISERHSNQGCHVTVFHNGEARPSFQTSYVLHHFFCFRLITKTYPLSKWIIEYYFKSIQDKNGYDIWQVNGGYPYGVILADFFKKRNIPCVLRCSGDDIQISQELNYGVRRNPKIGKLIEANYKKYSSLIAISDTVKGEYEKIGVPAEKIRSIPNGIDLDRVERLDGDKKRIKKCHEIPDSAKIILTVGRSHPKKGYGLIPKILSYLVDSGEDCYWVVIGKGVSELKSKKTTKITKKRLILLEEIGAQGSGMNDIPSDELICYYKAADVFAMTSLIETFGIVLVEAMAADLPVVGFDVPGVRDVVSADRGILCTPNDLEEFARALKTFLNSSGHRRNLPAISKYSWDSIADEYLRLYRELLDKRSLSCG